ncbi:hypothetical protein Hanom_Chr11g01009031 [Helianthus anomalus]
MSNIIIQLSTTLDLSTSTVIFHHSSSINIIVYIIRNHLPSSGTHTSAINSLEHHP